MCIKFVLIDVQKFPLPPLLLTFACFTTLGMLGGGREVGNDATHTSEIYLVGTVLLYVRQKKGKGRLTKNRAGRSSEFSMLCSCFNTAEGLILKVVLLT